MKYSWFRLMPAFDEEPGLGARTYVAGQTPGHPIQVQLPERNFTKAAQYLLNYGFTNGFVVIEWDLALEPDDITKFEDFIETGHFYDIVVAPYRLFPASTNFKKAVWAHRKYDNLAEDSFVQFFDNWCFYFSLGCAWLPPAAVKMLALFDPPARHPDADYVLSKEWGKGAYICWDCIPKHLHW